MQGNKQITFKVGFDSQDLDKDLNKIQEKLKTMQKQMIASNQVPQNFGGDKLLSGIAKTAFGDFSKENTEAMRKFYDEQRKNVLNENINIRSKVQELKKLSELEDSMTKDQKERVKLLKEEIDLMKTKQREQLDTLSKVKSMLPPEQQQGQATPQSQKSPSFMGKYGGMISMVGSAIAGTAMVAQTLDPYIQARIERDRNVLSNRAATNQMAQDYTRRSAEGQGSTFFYEKEDRNKALADAIKEGQAQNTKDTVMSIIRGAGGIAGAAGGAKAGFVTGAALGSFAGPIGTVAGGIIGGAAGAIGGFNLGSGSILSDKRAMNSMFDREAYMSQLTKENFGKYQQNLESNKALNMSRYMAQEYFLGNAPQFQQTQRQLGLSDRQMFGTPALTANGPVNQGGFYTPGLQAGFTTETQNQAIQGVLGAGGSTQMAQNPLLANQLQRDYRLTNASSILGRISGTGASAQESEEKTKKLLSEAFGAGLDMSKYGEETRKFLEVTSSIVASSGGGTLMASIASQGLVAPSMMGIQATASASEALNQMTSGKDQATAALQYAAMNQSGKFKELNPEVKSQLVNMTMEQIEADPALVKYMESRGISIDDVSSMKGQSIFKTKGADEKAQQLSAYIKEKGIKPSDVFSEAQKDEKLNTLLVEAGARTGLETGLNPATGQERASFVLQQQGLVNSDFRGKIGGLAKTEMTAADEAEKSKATDQLGQLNRVSTNLGALTDSFKANTEQSALMVETMKAFQDALKAGVTDLDKYREALANLASQQAGVPPTASTKKAGR